jgi:hypothetical protein
LFLKCSGIGIETAPSQLFQCAADPLGDALLKIDPTIVSRGVNEVLQAMKALAVIPVATGVLCSELIALKQKRDEPFRSFSARVRGKAETCTYTTVCTCECGETTDVDFTDHMIRDVLVAGIYDSDIRREVLSIDGIIGKPINDVIAIVESREMARDSLSPSISTSAVLSFKKESHNVMPVVPAHVYRTQRAACPHCRKSYSLFSENLSGWNAKPHPMCIDCYRMCRRSNRAQHHNKLIVHSLGSVLSLKWPH